MVRLGHPSGPPPGDDERAAALPAPVVAHLLESLSRAGHPVGDWAARSGFSCDEASADLRLPFVHVLRFLTEMVRALPERPLGLEAGGRPLLQSFGMLGVAIQTAPDVRGAVAAGLQFHRAAGSLVDFAVHEDAETIRLTLVPRSPDPALLPFLCEETMLSVTTLLRSALVDEGFAPAALDLPYPAPSYAALYERSFGCVVRFEAPAARMTVPRGVLDTPLPRREPAVHAAALAACRAVDGTAAQARELDHVWAVERLLLAELHRPCTMAGIARALNTTERTLRRNLADAGESFRAIHARVRRDRAEHLLRTTDLPLRAVAQAVGFADTRDFRRAFAGWTGRTPGEVRTDAGRGGGAIADDPGGSAVTAR
ncbi:hypothetical protein TPB0596_18010 [Tsukamurella pulmonis]|uniref:AraC family transcriptional regulator n=1 Tax=Tsukamurella pulmonis TaxID=47312 RepID=UPI001EDD05F5|nr:AraC family transcriptional regulator [Tsukamurella pulmonis]BDD82038.1 hypothetical protein TPB0596_18010 [Tsukamurella pulmonis]